MKEVTAQVCVNREVVERLIQIKHPFVRDYKIEQMGDTKDEFEHFKITAHPSRIGLICLKIGEETEKFYAYQRYKKISNEN